MRSATVRIGSERKPQYGLTAMNWSSGQVGAIRLQALSTEAATASGLLIALRTLIKLLHSFTPLAANGWVASRRGGTFETRLAGQTRKVARVKSSSR